MDLLRSLLSCFTLLFFLLTFALSPGQALAGDGATEALELRYQAERAISQERSSGNREMAQAMQEVLPGLLQEYLATRDGTIALDTVDAAFVEEQLKTALAAEEPGVALALDVYVGPGTGYEHGLQTALSRLADFHSTMAGRISEAALDSHERIMERHLDKIEQHLMHFDEVKLDAKLDAATERFTEKAEKAAGKAEAIAEKAEEKAEKAVEKVEKAVEKAEEKVEKAAEKASEKPEEKPAGQAGKKK